MNLQQEDNLIPPSILPSTNVNIYARSLFRIKQNHSSGFSRRGDSSAKTAVIKRSGANAKKGLLNHAPQPAQQQRIEPHAAGPRRAARLASLFVILSASLQHGSCLHTCRYSSSSLGIFLAPLTIIVVAPFSFLPPTPTRSWCRRFNSFSTC